MPPAQPRPPKANYTELTHQVVREAAEPLTFDEIMARVTALAPITTRNPKGTLRNAVGQSRLIAATGDGRYGWKPRLSTGSVLRLTLTAADLSAGRVRFTTEVRDALWPAFFEAQKRRDHSPASVQLPDGAAAAWPLEHLVEASWGTTAAPEFWRWFRALKAQAGDHLLITVIDGLARQFAVAFERRRDRDEAVVQRRNQATVQAALGFLQRHPNVPMLWDITSHLLATGQYRHPVPPDPLDEIWTPAVYKAAAQQKSERSGGMWQMAGGVQQLDAPGSPLEGLLQELFGGRPVREAAPEPPVRANPGAAGKIYQVKVTLVDSRPPIWRRIQVPADITLAKLHHVIQIVMGWYDSHLHHFRADGGYYSEQSEDDWEPVNDERHYRLADVAQAPQKRIHYEYDFGDSWEHELLVEKILPPEPGVHYPRCLKGARACPPEDVGGVWGYLNFLKAIRDPEHPEHEEYLVWVGGEFDPEAFDLEHVNTALRRLKVR